MGFADRMRGWLTGSGRRDAPSKSTAAPSRSGTRDLEGFAETRHGVEAYFEPKTAIYSTTLLLVAGDGEYLRRPIGDRAAGVALCKRLNVPLYDVARVGYPKRIRDFDAGVRRAPVRDEDLPPWPEDDAPEPGPPPPPTAPRGDDGS